MNYTYKKNKSKVYKTQKPAKTVKFKEWKNTEKSKNNDKKSYIEEKTPYNSCRMVAIRDNVMFNKKRAADNRHKYIGFFDKNNKLMRVVETTHLYEKEKAEKIQKGFIKAYQFGGENFPTGVTDSYYENDINNKHISLLKKGDIVNVSSIVTPEQAESIYNFSKGKKRR